MKLFGSRPRHSEEIYSQELQVLHEAERFRKLAVFAWDEHTIYSKCKYTKGSSEGQCGVTNFGFGLWLAKLRIVQPWQMFFEEGEILAVDGSAVGENHTWLRIDGVDDGFAHPDLSMRLDLAGDQFPAINLPQVVQYDDYFYPDVSVPSGNRIYTPAAVTPLLVYNIGRFAGRLERFMDNVCAVAESAAP